MIKMQIIGNLGADAHKFTREWFQVRVIYRLTRCTAKRLMAPRRKRQHGFLPPSMAMEANCLKYLTKGTKVFASGDARVKTFHSEKQRALVAGIDLFIRDIQLISVNRDDVPRDLYDIEGNAHAISKWFYSAEVRNQPLFSKNGEEFTVDGNGWVRPVQQVNGEAPAAESSDNGEAPAAETSDADSTKSTAKKA